MSVPSIEGNQSNAFAGWLIDLQSVTLQDTIKHD
jgi:hypothetical protein